VRLDVEPAGNQQVYVDGFYVGTPEDFAAGLEIEPGPHALEIRRAGYDALHTSINVVSGRSITYRGTLTKTIEPASPDAGLPSAPAQPSAAPMTSYIVPGCYVGNVPPEDAGLPARCDLTTVITIHP
jgi:hypothetical protein